MNTFTHKIEASPDFAMAFIQVPAGQTLKVEASAMSSMDSHLQMKTKLGGGFKRLLTSESLFINEFTAQGASAEISVAPGPSGDIGHFDIGSDSDLFLASGSFLACSKGVNLDTKFQGLSKGFFSGAGLMLIKCTGAGPLWFNSYGALMEIDIEDEYVVDTGHIVAFTSGLDYEIEKLGGYKSLFFSGEGFVAKFKGRGKLWAQTKSPLSFVGWADYYRRIERKDNS